MWEQYNHVRWYLGQ